MSVSLPQFNDESRELLPAPVGGLLRRWLRKTRGLVLLAFAGAGWLGLILWHAPSGAAAGGTTATAARVTASTADFLLQSFGLGATVFFAIPTFWSLELILGRPLARPLGRALAWPVTMLAAAGALSALPPPANWPFAGGLGGVVGDQIHALSRLFLPAMSVHLSGALTGLALALIAASLFAACVGVSSDGVGAAPLRHRNEVPGRTLPSRERSAYPARAVPVEKAPSREPWFTLARSAPPQPDAAPGFAYSDGPAEPQFSGPPQPIHMPYEDAVEADESARMAQRFAPVGGQAAAPRTAIAEPPAAWAGWKQFLLRPSLAEDDEAHADETQANSQSVDHGHFDHGRADAGHNDAAVTDAAVTEAPHYAPRATEASLAGLGLRPAREPASRVPPTSLLSHHSAGDQPPNTSDGGELAVLARQLTEALAEFGVRGDIIGVVAGSLVTQFEIEMAKGIKTSRVVGLAEDVARAVGVESVRIVPLPGRASLLIEIPAGRRGEIGLRELLESKAYRQSTAALPVALGSAADGQPIIGDLAVAPGLLLTGQTGSGKSMALQSLLASMLLRFAPAELRLLVVGLNGEPLDSLDGAAHLVAPAIDSPAAAVAALQWCVAEMDERLKAMAKLNFRSFQTYNNAVRNALRQGTPFKRAIQTGFDRATGRAVYEEEIIAPRAMPQLVVVIDDLELLLHEGGETVDLALQRLGQNGVGAGICLVAATGRIDSCLASPGVRAALPSRLSFKLASKAESRLILGQSGAEVLLSRGDFLFSMGGEPVRGQAPILAEGDLARVGDAVRQQARPSYEPMLVAALAAAKLPHSPPIRLAQALREVPAERQPVADQPWRQLATARVTANLAGGQRLHDRNRR